MYTIQLDDAAIQAIEAISYRFAWSNFLGCYQPLTEDGQTFIELTESEAWQLVQSIESDDGFLPCLSPNSMLYCELYKLINSVV
jgi:hypothetical protein